VRDVFRSADLQARFNREGFVCLDLLLPSDIAELTELYDRSSAAVSASSAWSFTAMTDNVIYRRAMSDGIRSVVQPRLERVLDRCRAVIGNFFHKQPSSEESQIHLHQDWSWIDERQHHSLSLWCPFQAVDETNGTLAVVPGSHRISQRPRGFTTRFPYPALEPVFIKYSRHLPLSPGQAVIFHQRLFHWSGPNRTPARRLAANCFVAPCEAALVFPHPDDPAQPRRIELFEADEDLLISFELGKRPAASRSLGFVDGSIEPLERASLDAILQSSQ
jgi:hypothetical protein